MINTKRKHAPENKTIDDQEYFNIQEKRMLKHILPKNGLMFSRYFFQQRESERFIVSGHHKILSKTLQKVLDGGIKRLIINVPPGYTKTEEAVIHFISRGLAINPKAKFLHASYSQELALTNSQTTRDVVESKEYQELFPMEIRKDTSAKKRWFTEHGGGVYAASTGGAITGYRAGRINEEKDSANKKGKKGKEESIKSALKKIRFDKEDSGVFSGAIVIDDPIKPDDAFSDTKRNKINNRFNNTIKSRLATEDVPIIIIMQRLHEMDLSGFLLTGGSGEDWHHLILPAEIPKEKVKVWYPKDYTHGIPLRYKLPAGALWRTKHTREQLKTLQNADIYTYSSQYLQRPSPMGGAIFKDEDWKLFTALPNDVSFMRIYGDTAQETNNYNDYSVLQAWCYSPSKGIFLVDQARGKWESPELRTNFIAFWNKQSKFCNNVGIKLQSAAIEKKSSGSGLFQTIRREQLIPVKGIDRSRGKVSRAFDTVPQIQIGNVWLYEKASWLFEYLDEFRKFTPMLTHKNDDQIDPTMDAIDDMLSNIQIYGNIKITGT